MRRKQFSAVELTQEANSDRARPLHPGVNDLSVPPERRDALLRSRRFASVQIRCAGGATLHGGVLNLVGMHLAGRNPMASTDGKSLFVQFALAEDEAESQQMVLSFAESVAVALWANPSAVEEARVLTFDTSDIDEWLLPEHRPEQSPGP